MPITSFSKASIGIYAMSREVTKPLPQYEFNLDSFRDPMNKSQFSHAKDGGDGEIKKWIKEDRRFPAILDECRLLAKDNHSNQKGAWLTICFRDFHGKWKSRAVAECVAEVLGGEGYNVCTYFSYKDGHSETSDPVGSK